MPNSYYLPDCEVESLKDYEKDLIDLRCELRISNEKCSSLESYSRGLELKVKELENKNKLTTYSICDEVIIETLDRKKHKVFVPINYNATQFLKYFEQIFGRWLSWDKKNN